MAEATIGLNEERTPLSRPAVPPTHPPAGTWTASIAMPGPYRWANGRAPRAARPWPRRPPARSKASRFFAVSKTIENHKPLRSLTLIFAWAL